MTRTVLSIDVGLRNLSMCILTSNFEILLWDNFNVLDSDEHSCLGLFKNGKVCGRKCNKKYVKGGDTIFTCKTHFPKEIKMSTVNDFKKKNIKEYPLQEIVSSFLVRLQEIYDNNNEIFLRLNTILIELQPTFNPSMKMISNILYGKMVELFLNKNVEIKYVRASEKLKAYTGPEIKCEMKGKYVQRKWLSIQYAKWFLEKKFIQEQKEKWLPVLEADKSDDKADTLCMAINGICGVPKKISKKIPKKV